jgi:hypothetical protein
MSNKESTKRIQVPNELLTNKAMKHEIIYLYIILKSICVKNKVNIYSDNLLKKLNWKDIRTLKKYLQLLYNIKYIDTNYDKMPKHKPLSFNLLNNTRKNYTQVDIDTIHKVIDVSKEVPLQVKKNITILNLQEMALRLFYIYEMYYNVYEEKAFPEYADITSNTGISSKYIVAINRVFEQKKIVKIKHGEWYETNDENDNVVKRKSRNEYKPKCNRAEIKTNDNS